MIQDCPTNCIDTRRKIMFQPDGNPVVMCYSHIAQIPSGKVKPIVTRTDTY